MSAVLALPKLAHVWAAIDCIRRVVHTPGHSGRQSCHSLLCMYGKVNVNHPLVSRVTYLLLSALHSHVPFKEG